MTKTQNFNLNQWDATDPIRRSDFNNDNAAIDAALAGKAEKSAVSAVETALANYKTSNDAAVAKKAEQTALSALSTNVTALSTALGSGGSNCRIAWGSYVGTGTCGAENPNVVELDFKPLFIWVARGYRSTETALSSYKYMHLSYPVEGGYAAGEVDVTWSDRSVQWNTCDETATASDQFNGKGATFYWLVLGVST